MRRAVEVISLEDDSDDDSPDENPQKPAPRIIVRGPRRVQERPKYKEISEDEDEEDENEDEDEDDKEEGGEEEDDDWDAEVSAASGGACTSEEAEEEETSEAEEEDDDEDEDWGAGKSVGKLEKGEENPDDEPKKSKKRRRGKHQRKKVRKLMTEEDLAAETRAAQKAEEERMERLAQRQAAKHAVIVLSSDDETTKAPSKSSGPVIEILDSSDDEATNKLSKQLDTLKAINTHMDDDKNVPDEQGRVLVNVDHDPDEPDIFLFPALSARIKAHQIGGVRMMYDVIVESLEQFKKDIGYGCILSHVMGAGKTFQMVCFIWVLLKYTTARKVMCIVPINVVQNWLAEFKMWLPKNERPNIFVLNDQTKSRSARQSVVKKWDKKGGVLVLGYEMFRLLAFSTDGMESMLLNPGADVVVCDEGHRIKNNAAGISKALKQIKTRRRIVLTGYPLQNNMMEYWCMVDFVRPNYLGTKAEFANMFENPIKNGQCEDSTSSDKRLMRSRLYILHLKLRGFVQRREHSVLAALLPPKEEYVLTIRLSDIQRELYNQCHSTSQGRGLFQVYQSMVKIWNHPDVLYRSWQNTQEGGRPSTPEDTDTLFWASEIFNRGYSKDVAENSYKIAVTLAIIEESLARGDRILVFSQSIGTLDVLENLLTKMKVPGQSHEWRKDTDYFRIDGSDSASQRERKINSFNDVGKSRAYCFLVSTKAGGIGINLVAANRVVVLDVGWNPVHAAQAVCRVYRFGQQKHVYIYRMVASNTMEEIIYEREVLKRGLADTVVEQQSVTANVSQAGTDDLYQSRPEEAFDPESVRVRDEVLCSIYRRLPKYFAKPPYDHSGYLSENPEDLTDADRTQAEKEFVMLQRAKDGAPMGRFIEHRADGTTTMGTISYNAQYQYGPRKPVMRVAPQQRSMQSSFPQIPNSAATVTATAGRGTQQPTPTVPSFIPYMGPSGPSPYAGRAEQVARQYAQGLDPYNRDRLDQVRSLFAAQPLDSAQSASSYSAYAYSQYLYHAPTVPRAYSTPPNDNAGASAYYHQYPPQYTRQPSASQQGPVDLYAPLRTSSVSSAQYYQPGGRRMEK